MVHMKYAQVTVVIHIEKSNMIEKNPLQVTCDLQRGFQHDSNRILVV